MTGKSEQCSHGFYKHELCSDTLRTQAMETFKDDVGGGPWQFQRDYHGRNYYHGPAVVCERDELQDVIRATTVTLQWDDFGKTGIIVYPRD